MDSRQVRAVFTDDTITVYQAYSRSIAVPAVAAGRFVPPFSRDRMTWIKPSFLWMVDRYVDNWIVSLTDITPTVHALHDQVRAGDHSGLPAERPYPLPTELARLIGA